MGVHLQRAMVLIEQSRHDLAEVELRQELLQDPHRSHVHALLALCLANGEKFAEATAAAQTAIANGPDEAFAHYALAFVLCQRNRLPEALSAIGEAIRLDPSDADYLALQSQILFDRRDWPAALAAAEAALEQDPAHSVANNVRAMALERLGRRQQAGDTVEATLARDPSNPTTHVVQGLLKVGRDPDAAIVHFSEALRLDPTNDAARAGLVEALKARNVVYRWMLNYFLWCQRLSGRAQWGLMLGGYFGVRMLSGVGERNPDWKPWITPLIVAYILFVWTAWLAYPFFNLLLRFSRRGRQALSDDQRRGTTWLAVALVFTLVPLALWPLTGEWLWGLAALRAGVCVIPISAIHRCQRGWPRWAMAGISAAVVLLAVANVGPLVFVLAWPHSAELAEQGHPFWLPFYTLALALRDKTSDLTGFSLLGATIAANVLMGISPKK